ncbi:DMT family transporter [Candidatus Leptofilum sp.]|uniref:DMT family transporter n=1 Tax=Candidatus Leptofilum sp. TaxID=3241576 RepID=UPI003B599BCA
MHTKALPYILLLSLFWGTNVVASRFGIGEFDPYLFVTLRLAIATLFFVPILLLNQGQLPTNRELWQKAAVSGVLGVAIPIPTFILSLQYQSSGVASIYVTTLPVMIVIAAHFLLPDDPITRHKALGVALALCGALFLALRGESGLADVGRASPLGFLLVMVGLVSEVFNTIFVRLQMQKLDPMQVTAVRLLVAAIIVLFVTLLLGDFSLAKVTLNGYFSLAYAALIGALGGQFMAFYVQRRFGATAFSLTSFMVPVIATIFGALLLGEIVTWAMGLGVLLIGSGLYLLNRRNFAH